MEDILYKSLLYDFYNGMLTEKQREIYEYYHHNDMSLSEISNLLNITPQGVSDILRRSEKALNNYEDKLGFLNNYKKQQMIIDEINAIIDKLEQEYSKEILIVLKEKVNNLI